MQKTVVFPSQKVPVLWEGDVVVVGGGTSGFIAAVAAAKTGSQTFLVEQNGFLGGCTTAPYNTSLSGFFDSDGNRILGGFPWDYLQRMIRDSQAFLLRNENQIWPVWTRKVALEMVEEAGVELLLHTRMIHVVTRRGQVQAIIVHNKAGIFAIKGKIYVDCTGDADLVAEAGGPFHVESLDRLQQISCDFIACGVNYHAVRKWALENRERLGLHVKGGEQEEAFSGPQPMLTITVPCQSSNTSQEFVHLGVMPTIKLCIYRDACRVQGNADVHPLDPLGLTQAEITGLKGALQHLEYMRSLCPEGFKHAYFVAHTYLGVRESRQIEGLYTISCDDVMNQRRFPDVVCLNSRGRDYHLHGTIFRYIPLKGYSDIPLRALIPQRLKNVIVGGRCLSCDHDAQASLRGAGACMGTGHAAGTAAALAAQRGCWIPELDVVWVQKKLMEQGAILRV